MDKRKHISYAKYGYIFSIPFVIAFLIFSLYPILYTLVIGFTDLQGIGKTELHLAKTPFENFISMFNNASFKKALGNTAGLWICNFIPQLGMALLLTAWYTDKRMKIKGKGLFKIIFYLPNIITAASVAILFRALFGYPMGPVNDFLTRFGLYHSEDGRGFFFFNDKFSTRAIIVFIQFWMWYGYTMVTLVSAVIGIDPGIFEAAELDGANRWQQFWRITIPCIRPIMLFILVTSMIGGLNMFDIPQLLNNAGNPDGASLTVNVLIYALAFKGKYQYNKAAATSVIMFVLIVAISLLLFFSLRDKDEAAARKARKRDLKERKMQEKVYGKAGF